MTIVLPLFFTIVGFAFFVHRMTMRTWLALGAIIAIIMAYNFFKPLKVVNTTGQLTGAVTPSAPLLARAGFGPRCVGG